MTTRKKILLTGASGTIGYEVLKQLYEKREEYEITAFDVKSPNSVKKLKLFSNEVEIVYGNISEVNDLIKVCSGKDVVIHLAAIIPPLADEKPKLSYQVNTVGTKNLIRLLEKNSPNVFFLYSSSISVYGDRISNPFITTNDIINPSYGDVYAETKIEAEESIKRSKLSWSIFRLSAIMGAHKISKLMFHLPLKTPMEIATPKDAARAFVNAIATPKPLLNRIFNLGGGGKCRIRYDEFLSRSFSIYGLGKLDFPPKSFAEKNFHCGYCADGDELENILNFRKETVDDYFEREKKKTSPFIKLFTSIFKWAIKKYLINQSEPLNAIKKKDLKMINRFFNISIG